MSQPTPYAPAHAFVSDSATVPNFPGQALDVEFQDVKTTTDQIRTNLVLIQRDDGALKNGVVTYDSLSTNLQTAGLAPALPWMTGTAYSVNGSVVINNGLYRALIAHTSGVFATDLAAGKWLFISTIGVLGTHWSTITDAIDAGCDATGATDSLAALIAYRNAVIANGSLTMILPAGTYAISGKLELGFAGLKVLALGLVILKHTGTGVAISFDAGAAPSTATVFDIEFGWGNDLHITGNASTTDLIFVRSCHHMKVGANVRNGTTGLRINFSVLSLFRLTCSANEAVFTATPVNGLVTNVRNAGETVTDCVFNVIVEGVSGEGLDLFSCVGCEFRGTSEANAGGGVRIRSGSDNSIRNTFIGFDCEANGTNSQDWNIEGDSNLFINCLGALTTSTLENIVSGVHNVFIGGRYDGMTVHAQATGNIMKGVALFGTPILNSPSATYESCTDGSGNPIGDAWVPYTSTFAATTGTATVTARQKTSGKTICVNITVQFTSAVTGTFSVTLPFASKSNAVVSGREITSLNTGAAGFVTPTSSVMSVLSASGTQYTANGNTIVLTGSYEAS